MSDSKRREVAVQLAEADGHVIWSQIPEAYLREADEVLKGDADVQPYGT